MLLLLPILMLIIIELIKPLKTTIQGAPHSFFNLSLIALKKISLLFQTDSTLFLFSVQTVNISSSSTSIPSDDKLRYTNTFYSTVYQSPASKKTFFNHFRNATHAAENDQIGIRHPRLKPSAADAAHIW
jgi:hypothetical protein